jgi:hypothetical protein
MQEVYQESAGLLARAAQRKETILYKMFLERRRQKQAEKYEGFVVRPRNLQQVKLSSTTKHFLHEISDELGNKIARICNPNLISIEKDGEIVVRQLNEEINALRREKRLWERHHLALVTKETGQAVSAVTDKDYKLEKYYFGCARELPEGREWAEGMKRTREDSPEEIEGSGEEHEVGDGEPEALMDTAELPMGLGVDAPFARWGCMMSCAGVSRYQKYILNMASDADVRAEEAFAREEFKNVVGSTAQRPWGSAFRYIMDFREPNASLPSDQDVRRELFEKKKQALLQRAAALKR